MKLAREIWRADDIHGYLSTDKNGGWLTLAVAAKSLGVTNHVIRRLIEDKIQPAEQLVPRAPDQIRAEDLDKQAVIEAMKRRKGPHRDIEERARPTFSDS